MQDLYLSVDLGGTSLRIAILDSEGKFHFSKVLESKKVRLESQLVDCLNEEFLRISRDPKLPGTAIVGAALGIPGLVNSDRGIIYQSPHFPQWKNFALLSRLAPDFPFPIIIDNDANKAALGEAWKGAGKDWEDFVMLTLGTGVGGGIIWRRKIFHGTEGLAGEVGHMVIERHGKPGALGIKGTLETFTSLSGLKLQWEQMKNTTQDPEFARLDPASSQLPEALVRLAQGENKPALAVWRDFGEALACGIASLANILGIFNFVIGGGLAGAWDLFSGPCREEIPKRSYATLAKKIKIVPAQLGNDAGLIGGVPMIQQAG
jgi:glucokinase